MDRRNFIGTCGPDLEWERGGGALTVKLPKDRPCEHAFALKIAGLLEDG